MSTTVSQPTAVTSEAATRAPIQPSGGATKSTPILQIEPWPDPVIDALGHDPRSLYAELFWLSILGPSTTWLLRRVARHLDEQPDGFALDCAEASLDLGLGGHTGKHSVLMRSVDRCCHFGMAQRHGETMFVRRYLPPLSMRQVERLPPALASQHHSWAQRPTRGRTQVPQEPPTERARQLALTLLQLGEQSDAVERQLHHWNFHPSLAWNAVQWAEQMQGEAP